MLKWEANIELRWIASRHPPVFATLRLGKTPNIQFVTIRVKTRWYRIRLS